jgi:hypothetical protein
MVRRRRRRRRRERESVCLVLRCSVFSGVNGSNHDKRHFFDEGIADAEGVLNMHPPRLPSTPCLYPSLTCTAQTPHLRRLAAVANAVVVQAPPPSPSQSHAGTSTLANSW